MARVPPRLRTAVLVRDRGVCRDCGLDAVRLRSIIQRVFAYGDGPRSGMVPAQSGRMFGRTMRARMDVLAALGFSRWDVDRGSLWEAHHVVPPIEGGPDDVTEDDLATLCLRCHRKHTAGLAARRRHARRFEERHGYGPHDLDRRNQ